MRRPAGFVRVIPIVIVGLVVALVVGLRVVNSINTFETVSRASSSVVSGVGVVCDSQCDEYRAEDNRGGSYGATTFNWIELLARYRGVNFGRWGEWGGVRRSGYEYNWSRSGATTTSGIANNQHVGVAEAVERGDVSLVIYALGANDFAWYNPQFGEIYSGSMSGERLDAYVARVVANIRTGVERVAASGKAKVVVVEVPDMTLAVGARQRYPDTVRLKRVADAVARVNREVRSYAGSRGLAFMETGTVARQLVSAVDSGGNLVVGGEKISYVTFGDEPHHVVLGDRVHAGTVYSGVYANLVVDFLNTTFDAGLKRFSEEEIVAYAGIAAGGQGVTGSVSRGPRATATPSSTRPTVTGSAPISSPVRPTVVPIDLTRYCPIYRRYRRFLVGRLSLAQVREWDVRCGVGE